MITYTTQETVSHVLTQEGAQIALQGSHEARVWNVCPAKGEGPPLPIKELQAKVGLETAKIGQGQAFKNKWIGKEGDGLVKLVGIFIGQSMLLFNKHRPGLFDRRYYPAADARGRLDRNPESRGESACRSEEA